MATVPIMCHKGASEMNFVCGEEKAIRNERTIYEKCVVIVFFFVFL